VKREIKGMPYKTYVSKDQFGVPVIYLRRGKEFIGEQEVKQIAEQVEGRLNDELWIAERAEEAWQERDAA
jgi:hypothetical protein